MRRRLFLAAGPLALAGCGFHPVYAPGGGGAAGASAEELAAVEVALIPNREGQVLRQDVQARLERFGLAVAKRYKLLISYDVSQDPIGIQPDNSTTFIRMRASANWTLNRLDPKATLVTTGLARAMDGFNVIDQQVFTSDLETESVTRKLSETVADQISLQLAMYFNQHPAVG